MGPTLTDPLIGQVVDGRYAVVARIARGGMATVYRATDRRLDRDVALKVMHPHLTDDRDFVARFRREARAAARLTHPGIVAVFDQGTAGESPYLVMELVEGHTLRSELAECSGFLLGRALDVLDRVLDALAAAHRQGIVHRDIKPENVLLTADGDVKVADFGLARAVTDVTAGTTGTVLGTVAYLSPELVGRGRADARSDVYACGIMAYEMVCGRQPFVGETPIQVAFQHVNSSVPRPSDRCPWIPSSFDDLVLALTAREPADRVADAAQARELLLRTRSQLTGEELHRHNGATMPGPPAILPVRVQPADRGESSSTPTTGAMAGTTNGTGRPAIRTVPSPASAEQSDADAATTGALTRRRPPAPIHTERIPLTHEQPTKAHRLPTSPGPAVFKRRRLLVAIIALVVVALVAGVGWYFLAGPGARIAVPALAGLTQQQATQKIDDSGLSSKVTTSFDDHVASGKVISTDPTGGTKVPKDQLVTLVVSKGIQMIAVPTLAGQTSQAAQDLITKADLNVGTITQEWSQQVPSGQVISSDPAAGTSIPHTQAVDLVVSKGPEPVTMPNVVGKTLDQAKATLSDLSLGVKYTEEYSTDYDNGVVMSQAQGAGATVHRGDTVSVVVSKGPEMVQVPQVRGKQFADAKKELEGLGFKVKKQDLVKLGFDTVYGTDPAAGKSVPKGSTITVSVV